MSNAIGEVVPTFGAGAVVDTNRFEKFFTMTPADVPAATTEAPGIPAEPVVVADPPAVPDAQQKLADTIRKDREERQARAAKEAEAKTWKERAEKAEADLAATKTRDMVQDTVGWADDKGLTPEERALMGETLLYSLVPDQATAEVRIKLMEAKKARADKKAEELEAQKTAEAEKAEVMKVHQDYVAAITVAAQAIPPGTFPDSEAWFGEDQQSYIGSLYATANNLAEAARAEGKVADLSLDVVAKVLEADMTSRFERRKPRGAAVPSNPVVVPTGESKPAPEVVMSPKGLSGGGTPRPPAKTEAERVARAIEALTRSK